MEDRSVIKNILAKDCLTQLDNHILLVGNFIPEGADLGVLGVLVLLALLNG